MVAYAMDVNKLIATYKQTFENIVEEKDQFIIEFEKVKYLENNLIKEV